MQTCNFEIAKHQYAKTAVHGIYKSLGQQRAPPRAAGIAESMGRKGRGIVLGGDIVSGLARYLRDVV